jgi:hypothetical protein
VLLRVVLDGGGDHAEADAEEAARGRLVLGLEADVEPVVRGRELAAAVLLGAGDVAEAGVEALGPPRLGGGQLHLLLLAVNLLEHRDVVVALAPHELLLLRLARRRVGVEEGEALLAELVERGLVGHRWSPGRGAQNLTVRSR